MGKYDINISEESLEKLRILVDENKNLNQIQKELNLENNYYKTNAMILRLLQKVWYDNKYANICTSCNKSKNTTIKEDCTKKANSKKTTALDDDAICFLTEDKYKDAIPENFDQQNKKAKDVSLETQLVINSMNSVSKSIESFNQRLCKIENFIDEMKRENPNEKKKEYIDKIAKIYSANKNKKSINLNKELEDEVSKHMKEKYGISDNLSTAINTALLLSLYE